MKNSMKILSLLLVLALIFTACAGSSDDEEANEVPKESLEDREQLGDLEILGLAGGEEKVAISHIMKMESTTKTMTNISSSGEVEEPAVTGIELDKILTQFGVSQNDFTGIRFYAADGYSIEIPGEILQKRTVMLIWRQDGQYLEEKFQPLRVAVPHERSMYWVGNLKGMELKTASIGTEEEYTQAPVEKMDSVKVVFMDPAIRSFESMEYTYYEQVDQAVKVKEFFSEYNNETEDKDIYIEAVDDFAKNEEMEIFTTGYIKYTGEYAPLFLSPELPEGMHVKNILWMTNGSTIYLSEAQAFEKFKDELVTVLEDECVPMMKVEELTGMPVGEKYILTAADGYTKEVDREMFEKAAIYARIKGGYGISFQGIEKNQKVKDILAIEILTK